jgi:hypothetical protein
MDGSNLISQVVPAAQAAIGAYGTAALTRDPDESADAQVELGRELLQTLYWRANNVPQLEGAVDDLATMPGDRDAIGALRLQIRKALAADNVLRDEMAKVLGGQQTKDAAS